MSRVSSLVLAVLLGSLLVGCTTVGEDLEPTGEVPSTVESTVPASMWSDADQVIIDAVQKYLEVWADIGQNITTTDWYRIQNVASFPQDVHDLEVWANWKEQNWHLVGAPVYTVESIHPGVQDENGTHYHVYGCFIIVDSYISDIEGRSVGDDGRVERSISQYEVLQFPDGLSIVINSSGGEGDC